MNKKSNFSLFGFFFMLFFLLYASMSWKLRWMSDDGLINIRVIQNWLQGHGFVFNIGERVEATTSTIWVVWIALLGKMGFSLEKSAVYLGWIFSVTSLPIGVYACSLFHRRKDDRFANQLFLPLGLVVFTSFPPFWDFATSGLENGFMIFWFAVSYLAFALCARHAQGWKTLLLSGFWLSMGPLIRPELALFSLFFGSVLWWHWFQGAILWKEKFKRTFCFAIALGLLPVSYQIFRMGYFALLVPNTALAKEAFVSRWSQGANFFHNFFFLYSGILPLLVVGFVLFHSFLFERKRHSWFRNILFVGPFFFGLFYVLYVVKVGGGFMHGRMFMGPLFCLLLPTLFLAIPSWNDKKQISSFLLVGLLCLWSLTIVFFVRVPEANQFGIGDERGWYSKQARHKNPIEWKDFKHSYLFQDAHRLKQQAISFCKNRELKVQNCPKMLWVERVYDWLPDWMGKQELEPKTVAKEITMVVMRSGMGIRSQVFGKHVHVVDNLGLTSPLTSRLSLEKRGRPGHEKNLRNIWLVARFAKPKAKESEALQWARKSLSCKGSPMKRIVESITKPLTWGLFWANAKQSFSNTRVRFHPEPFLAYQEMCKGYP